MKAFVLFVCAALALPGALSAQKKEIVELQRDIALLQDQVRTMQRSMDEKLAAVQVLLQQTLDTANKTNTSVAVLESGFRDRMRDFEKQLGAPTVALGSKVDTMASEFSALKESVADVSSRLGKVQTQIVDLGNAIKIMNAPPTPPPPTGGMGAAGGPPPGMTARGLYDNAQRDMGSGNADLALQQFQDYLKFYGDTELAPNAQFYVGQIHYNQKDYEAALSAFDMVLEKFPDNTKTPDAMFMKGRTLLLQGKHTAAATQFRELIKRFPSSDSAAKAKVELKNLGLSAAPAATKRRR